MKALGNLKKGLLFVVSAPAGTGKTTLVQMLCEEFSCVVKSVSCTTRNIRPNEIEGKDYHHLSFEEFERRISKGEFLEYATVFGNYYGTSRLFVEEHLHKGKHVILVIDTQGALQLKGKIEAVSIFIRPPSISELRKRLRGRKTDSEQEIENRLSWAEDEMKLAKTYDYHIVNESLPIAYTVLQSILIAEEHKNR